MRRKQTLYRRETDLNNVFFCVANGIESVLKITVRRNLSLMMICCV